MERLKDVKDIQLPKIRFNSKYVFHLFVIKTEKRDQLKTYLSENNKTGIHYPIALPDLKAYKNLNYPPYTLNAQNNSSYLLSLPIGDHMKTEDADFVISKIKRFLKLNTVIFYIFSKTNWEEMPRLRHQIARMLAKKGHKIFFFSKAKIFYRLSTS